MKTLALLAGLTLLTGCLGDGQRIVKSTTLGLEIGTDANNIPTMRLGLIRHTYMFNPTFTNAVYAAPVQADVNASIGFSSQTAIEKTTLGQ